MANVLVLGGGFGGVVAAEELAQRLGAEHQITLVSRGSEFLFYPALVRLAFGRCEPDDVSFDLRQAMRSRRIQFVQAEVARVNTVARRVSLWHGEVEGEMSYDYLIFALGRRLDTERVPGFSDHAHHLLTLEAARKFGEAVKSFHRGHAVIGYCPGARLTVPVYETAFALDRLLRERGERERAKITLVSPEPLGDHLGGADLAIPLYTAMVEHGIEFKSNFPVSRIAAGEVWTNYDRLAYDLLMLIPPFRGTGKAMPSEVADEDGYLLVDPTMRVREMERVYAVGDAVSFPGPKLGHLAVVQGEVAAANVAAEVEGRTPEARYRHELMLVIEEGGKDSLFLRQDLWEGGETSVRQGHFWDWAKRVQEKYWQRRHS